MKLCAAGILITAVLEASTGFAKCIPFPEQLVSAAINKCEVIYLSSALLSPPSSGRPPIVREQEQHHSLVLDIVVENSELVWREKPPTSFSDRLVKAKPWRKGAELKVIRHHRFEAQSLKCDSTYPTKIEFVTDTPCCDTPNRISGVCGSDLPKIRPPEASEVFFRHDPTSK